MENSKTIERKEHPRITKVVHKYNNSLTWEKALEMIIINHLKEEKRLA